MKRSCGMGLMMVLASASVAVAGNNASYPDEKVGEFVVEKLDVTTLPSMIRPKVDKGKKTFGESGYPARELDEKRVLIETPAGSQINIRILEQQSTGIYVCFEGPARNARAARIQRVLLLKLDDGNGLLKGKESSKEFVGCPAVGGPYDDSQSSGY